LLRGDRVRSAFFARHPFPLTPYNRNPSPMNSVSRLATSTSAERAACKKSCTGSLYQFATVGEKQSLAAPTLAINYF
jgi:hypothetical protein